MTGLLPVTTSFEKRKLHRTDGLFEILLLSHGHADAHVHHDLLELGNGVRVGPVQGLGELRLHHVDVVFQHPRRSRRCRGGLFSYFRLFCHRHDPVGVL